LIPEFLTLLKGVLDCPDLPLNVSRSYLQNDPTVRKISEHITKKVADKLSGMAKTDREAYEKYWDDISPFVKYGMMRDHKFMEKMKDHIIWKSTAGGYLSIEQYIEKMKDKTEEGVVLYCTDPVSQAAYVKMLKDHDMDAVVADTMIDLHFIPHFEMETSRKYKFKRIDSDLCNHLIETGKSDIILDAKDSQTVSEKISKMFRDHLAKEKVKVRIESFKSEKMPAMLIFDEQMQRMKAMSRKGAMAELMGSMPMEHTLVVNQNNPAIKNLLSLAVSFNKEEDVKMVVNQIYDLAWLQQGEFTAEMMESFIERSSALLGKIGGSSTAPANIITP